MANIDARPAYDLVTLHHSEVIMQASPYFAERRLELDHECKCETWRTDAEVVAVLRRYPLNEQHETWSRNGIDKGSVAG